MSTYFLFALLFCCGVAALATLLIFLETGFAVSSGNRFVARRASGAYGIVSVFLPVRGSVGKVERTIQSILGQSYPFIELILIYSEDDARHAGLVSEFGNVQSHVAIRTVSVTHPVRNGSDVIRSLECAQPTAKGRWYAVVDAGVMLDRLAIETSLEFAGTGEISALALRPGLHCRSFIQRLLAPSLEYLLQLVRMVERNRERARQMSAESGYLLMNRDMFEAVNRINRMPGILNEAGWNLWSYQVEGLRTFEGDGSRWLWREIALGKWLSPETQHQYTRRSKGMVIASTVTALIPVAGVAYGFSAAIDTFSEASIFAFSAVSYALMAISYYLYARRLQAAAWFAPLWFMAHVPASIVALLEIRRAVLSKGSERSEVVEAIRGQEENS